MLRKLFTATAMAAALFSQVVSAQEIKEINFGIISTESSSNLKAAWQPILEDMGKKTGYKITAI